MVLFLTSMKNLILFNDAAKHYQLGFQDPATPIMEGIIDIHHTIFMILTGIGVFVFYILARIIYFYADRNSVIENQVSTTHHTMLEIVWTITPSLILICIAAPSFSILYGMDEVIDPAITIKAIGHQWYWSYEYSDYPGDMLAFDSYMVPEDELKTGELRLLEVDNRVVLPIDTHVRVIVTSADVIHSWAVPSLGVKVDAVPGRLNQTSIFLKREGVYYGQCSEICGVNHGFMPIVVQGVSLDEYIKWVETNINN